MLGLLKVIMILSVATAQARKPASVVQREIRLEHARELLGRHYKQSAVRSGEKVQKINQHIYSWTKERLPRKFRKDHKKIAQAIIDTAQKYEFDPVFLLSVIQGESSFNPEMRGKAGEIGLMQILPRTGEWVAGLNGFKWKGEASLKNPVQNIRIGAAFLHQLEESGAKYPDRRGFSAPPAFEIQQSRPALLGRLQHGRAQREQCLGQRHLAQRLSEPRHEKLR